MRNTSKAAGIVLAVAAVLALAGCVPPTPEVIPTSAPSAKPVFASDAAALAAAKAAYSAYLAVSDAVASDGGQDPSQFASVVTSSWFPREKASAASLLSSHRRQIGSTTFDRVRLQAASQVGEKAVVSIYACLNLSAIQYVDSASGGNPSPPAVNEVPVEADLVSSKVRSPRLLVERNVPWQGSDFCA
jgi:hypothetical protein